MQLTAYPETHTNKSHMAMIKVYSINDIISCHAVHVRHRALPVTHMPEKLYMSNATMSISSTMAIGREWKIICSAHTGVFTVLS